MSKFTYDIHDHLTRVRRSGSNNQDHSSDQFLSVPPKEYPRMERTQLPSPLDLSVSLQEALARRRSSEALIDDDLTLQTLSTLLSSLSGSEHLQGRGRTYPSGGACYPIETYVFAQRVAELPPLAFHYHPYDHALEHLWKLPDPLQMFPPVNAWAESARAILVFTSSWWRNKKYNDFGYMLGLLEAGHMSQNVLLTAAALELPARPISGFNDETVAAILDIDTTVEQPITAIAFG